MLVLRCTFDEETLQRYPRKKGRNPSVLVVGVDGINATECVTRAQWAMGGHHINWHPDSKRLVMNLTPTWLGEPKTMRFCAFNCDGSNLQLLSRNSEGSGHPSIDPTGRYLVADAYPILVKLVNPFFVGKDARDLDRLVEDVLMHANLYKYQGYPIWIPIATVELAILDMLGRIAGKSMGELIGNIHNTEIAICRANNNRGFSAEETIRRIKRQQAETGAKAVKFKIGGRRSIPEKPAGRTERLIPMMREHFGDRITIYADCNGSYDATEAIRVGKLLQEHGIDLFEQPVPTDWYEDWKIASDALTIPIASGGGEVSMRCFRWLIGNDAVQMVQQDLFYFGGMIRCMKVARMAATKGYVCTPHISGTGLGYIYMMHFVSAIPNAGPYHEFKGLTDEVPFECKTSSLKPEDGILHLPKGVGSGVEIDPDFIARHRPISA